MRARDVEMAITPRVASDVEMAITPRVPSGESAVDVVIVGLTFGKAQGPVGKALMIHEEQI